MIKLRRWWLIKKIKIRGKYFSWKIKKQEKEHLKLIMDCVRLSMDSVRLSQIALQKNPADKGPGDFILPNVKK